MNLRDKGMFLNFCGFVYDQLHYFNPDYLDGLGIDHSILEVAGCGEPEPSTLARNFGNLYDKGVPDTLLELLKAVSRECVASDVEAMVSSDFLETFVSRDELDDAILSASKRHVASKWHVPVETAFESLSEEQICDIIDAGEEAAGYGLPFSSTVQDCLVSKIREIGDPTFLTLNDYLEYALDEACEDFAIERLDDALERVGFLPKGVVARPRP